jgi:hypothetical protein
MVRVPVLVVEVPLGAAVNETVPDPDEEAGDTVSHAAPLVAVQVQPVLEVIVTVAVPPDAPNEWLVAESV